MSSGKANLGRALVGCATLGLTSIVSAQTPRIGMRQGETVIGMGSLEGIGTISINDANSWVSLVDTDGGTAFTDGAIIRNGFVTLREGTPLARPTGAEIDDWRMLDINHNGVLGMACRIKPAGPGVDDAALWNFTTVVATDDVVSDPLVGVGTTWDFVDWVAVSDSAFYVMGSVRNPDVNRIREQILMRFEMGANDQVLSQEILGTEGMALPALGDEVIIRALGTSPTVTLSRSSFDCNREGNFISYLKDLFTDMITLNHETIIAQVGGPSPIPGRPWEDLTITRVSINDRGHMLYTGLIDDFRDADAWIMVLNEDGNERVLFQSGDIIPSFQPAPLPAQRSTLAPVVLCNNGDVFWRADGTNDAIMRNDEAVLQEIVTQFNGLAFVSIPNGEDSFSASPDGRYLASLGRVGGSDVIVFVDFGVVVDIPGCTGNEGILESIGERPALGATMTFSMDNGNVPNAITRITFSTRAAIPGSDCGIMSPFGELFTSRANRVGRLFLPAWDGSNPTTQTSTIPNLMALVNSKFWAQGSFRERNTTNVRLTNGLRIEIGVP